MSKVPQRRKASQRRPRPEEKLQRSIYSALQKHLVSIALIVVLAGIPFALGKYFEFSIPEPFDGGGFLYSAQHILSGARIGHEITHTVQPGTVLVNMVGVKLWGFRDIGPKVLQMVFQLAALIFMFITLRRVFGTLAAGVGVIVASIYLSAPLIAKYGNVKEQFMIALMISGICSFVYYQLTGKWWWAVLTGALLFWGPLFKPTGLSAIGAVGFFVLVQPVLRRVSWKRAGRDVALLVAGAVAMLAPLCIWYASMDTPLRSWPYSFLYRPLISALAPAQEQAAEPQPSQAETTPAASTKPQSGLVLRLLPGYIRDSWEALGPAARKDAFLRVLRYYRLLILPILLALGAILARLVVLLRARGTKHKEKALDDPGRFIPLFAVWWLVDMAFVWVSPRSYEQYYLPLNASAAMLGSYSLYLFARRWHADRDKTRWIIVGLLGLVLMLVLSWHIFFGVLHSPHSGQEQPAPYRGYLQKWREVRAHPVYDWARVGDYIRENSQPTDTIYVWGWVPGIYVRAQRMSSAPKAFEGTMHTLPPQELAIRVQEILESFKKDPPKFIVDTLKIHFPWDRPPLELWPNIKNALRLLGSMPRDNEQLWRLISQTFGVLPSDLTAEGFLRPDKADAIKRYDGAYGKTLGKKIGPDEAQRFDVMKPFRDYVVQNYRIVSQLSGQHVLFVRK